MTDNDTNERLESLETRLMHQEAALDELTRTLLQQERLISKQAKLIQHLEEQLNILTSATAAAPANEPPPHY